MNFSKIPLHGDFVSGKFQTHKDTDFMFEIRSPANFKDQVAVLEGSFHFIDEAFETAEKVQHDWYQRGLEFRTAVVKKLIEEVQTRSKDFSIAISREIGKPLWESEVEVRDCLDRLHAEIELAVNREEQKAISEVRNSVLLKSGEKLHTVRRAKPRGVVVVLGHYNDPLSNPLTQMIPSLLHGNCVVFKPSKRAPVTGQIIAECMAKVGVPAGVFAMLQGGREMARRMVQHHCVNTIFYSGDFEFGKQLRKDTFEHSGKLLAFETGGKNPAIIWEGANLEAALWETLIGAYITTGQRQESTSRILLHRSLAEEFLMRFHKLAKAFVIGNPFDEKSPPFMGPLVDKKTLDRYLTFQGIGMRENSKCVMRGKSLSIGDQGYYVSPSIFLFESNAIADIHKSVYLQTEIFGPSVGVHIVDEVDEAIAMANASNYGLACSVFTQNESTFREFWRGLRYGQIHWNEGTFRKSTHFPSIGTGRSYKASPLVDAMAQHVIYPVTSIETGVKSIDVSTLPPGLRE